MLLTILYALVVIVSLLLIALILIQPSKSGGMGAAFGGIGESVFGAQAGSHLTKATVVLTAVFLLLSLFLAALIGHGFRSSSSGDAPATNYLESKAAAPAVPVNEAK
ncbi:MAG: preprotein translocase subunit SecG [Victivallaceae bacterium]|nr:preprotein translocase subunit SecG [Victivallaceae bacterium]